MEISELKPNPNNPRNIKGEKFDKLVKSIKEFPRMMELRPIVVNSDGIVLGGNMRLEAVKKLGKTEIPDNWVIKADDLTPEQQREFIIKDNVGFGEWDWGLLETEWDQEELMEWGLDIPDFEDDEEGNGEGSGSGSLVAKFVIPPFSVFDTRQGYWQERKRAWIGMGINSAAGRDENLIGAPDLPDYANFGPKGIAPQTSIFDPVLGEVLYKWFCPIGGQIVDPFAGGSVRGIVAAKLGFQYIGVDLREEQVTANRGQAETVLGEETHPVWVLGNSLKIGTHCKGVEADFIFSCPPYFDLEVYSDDPEDLSNGTWDQFREDYRTIIKESCSLLKADRFACFVVGDIRDKNGFYRNFIGITIDCFESAGCILYNSIILIEQSGTAAMRAGKLLSTSRKVVKTHQNVLIFYKGDPKKIKGNFGDVDVMDIEDAEGDGVTEL